MNILNADFERYPSHLAVRFVWEGETQTFSREEIRPKPVLGEEKKAIESLFARTFAKSHSAKLGTVIG
jgi:hypothetical protein